MGLDGRGTFDSVESVDVTVFEDVEIGAFVEFSVSVWRDEFPEVDGVLWEIVVLL